MQQTESGLSETKSAATFTLIPDFAAQSALLQLALSCLAFCPFGFQPRTAAPIALQLLRQFTEDCVQCSCRVLNVSGGWNLNSMHQHIAEPPYSFNFSKRFLIE